MSQIKISYLKKMLELALHLYLGVLTTDFWKSRTFLVLKAMLFAIKELVKFFLLTVKSDMQWKNAQWEKVLLVFKRKKVNRGKETSIAGFQDETEVIIFVWY